MWQDNLLLFSVDEALEIIFSFDGRGTIVYANNAAMKELEYGREICGYHISDIFPGPFKATADGFSTELELGNNIYDIMAYRKNKTCFRAEVKIMRDKKRMDSYICMATDVSKMDFLKKEIARVEQEADVAMKVKSEFVANVTHELRTPVNGILGNTRELAASETDDKKLRILNLIEHGCCDMNNIINNILDFSKLEAGKFTLEPRKFSFRNMIDYVKSNHNNKITEKGLQFFVTVSPDVPENIIADELRIEQVLNNLLSNATKFTTVGKIALEVIKTAQINNRAELFFFVMDSGIGIDKSDMSKLFKSFSQVDASISRRYGGTGLGLNICKQLVELMGGNIGVESQKDKGSTFSFSVWVELADEESKENVENQNTYVQRNLLIEMQEQEVDEFRKYGTEDNLKEIKQKLSKLILSVEMENWEKAEMFVDAVKQLTAEAPREVKSMVLKLKMAIQKENYEKTSVAYESLQELIE